MEPVTPLTGSEPITPTAMNAVAARLDGAMDTILGGRSPILLFAGDTAIESVLWGKPFYFTAGRCTYAPRMPFAPVFTITATDPITGAAVNVPGVRAYAHSYFTAAATAAVIQTYNSPKSTIATIPNIVQAAYPPGLTKFGRISLFEHSLEAHFKMAQGPDDTEPRKYWLYELDGANQFEGGGVWPTKRYKLSLAEIICEGVPAVDLRVCALEDFKFECLRLHNLQEGNCVVTLPDGAAVTLTGFECRSYRLNVARTAFERSQFRYFQTIRPVGTPPARSDPRHFWFFASYPAGSDFASINDSPFTSTAGMQGNNISCPVVMLDWIRVLTDKSNHAWLEKDLTELIDLRATIPEYVDKFGDPAVTTTKLMDLLHHKGRIVIARTSNITGDATFEDFDFNGAETLIADLAEKQIEATVNAAGNLELLSTDPDNVVDLIPQTTNLLKSNRADIAGDSKTPTSVNDLQATPFEIEDAIFENIGGAHQDRFGVQAFRLRSQSDYRITQRRIVSEANARTYLAPSGVTTSVPGDDWQTLEDIPVSGSGAVISGIHSVTVSDLLSLKHHGGPALPSQSDSFVTYGSAALKLTPEGYVYTFTERLAGGVILPPLHVGTFTRDSFSEFDAVAYDPVTGEFTAAANTVYAILTSATGLVGSWTYLETVYNSPHIAPAGYNFYRLAKAFLPASPAYHSALQANGWLYDLTADTWTLTHAVRLRRHGFGWTQHGKHLAAFFTPIMGRARTRLHGDEQAGINSGDYGHVPNKGRETAVKILGRIPSTLLNSMVNPGGRFMTLGPVNNLDGLVAFSENKNATWYSSNRGRGADMGLPDGQAHPGNGNVFTMALGAEHYNLFAQAVNQLKTGKPLSWKAIRIVYGSALLDFSTLPKWDERMFSAQAPAPATAFISLYQLADEQVGSGQFGVDITAYWVQWLAARNVPVATPATDLPASVAAFSTQDNLKRTLTMNGQAALSNATYGGDFQVFHPSVAAPQSWRYIFFNADVTLSYQSHSVGATSAVAGQRGLAWIPNVPIVNNIDPLNRVNLSTAWTGFHWLKTNDFKALAESFGFTVAEHDVWQPLVLDWFRAEPNFDVGNLTADSTVRNSRVCAMEFNDWNNPPPNAGTAQIVQTVALINARAPDAIALTVSFVSDQIGFRMAETEAEAAAGFKLPAAKLEPPTAHYYENRTTGRLRFSAQLSFGWNSVCRLPPNAMIGGPATWNQTVLNSGNQGFYLKPQLSTYELITPFNPTAPSFDYPVSGTVDPTPANSRIFCTSQEHRAHIRAVLDLAISSNPQQDAYGAHVNGERKWFAAQLIASSATAQQKFNLIPQGHWESVLDWWLEDADSYMQSIVNPGYAANIWGQDVPRSDQGWIHNDTIKPPRWVTVGALANRRVVTVTPTLQTTEVLPAFEPAPAAIALAAGIAILKANPGELLKVIYDPNGAPLTL